MADGLQCTHPPRRSVDSWQDSVSSVHTQENMGWTGFGVSLHAIRSSIRYGQTDHEQDPS